MKEVVNSAKFITNDLGGLPAALSPRTVDTNKILATQVRSILGYMVGTEGRGEEHGC